jgi:mono/diheme cytochrome c family protein
MATVPRSVRPGPAPSGPTPSAWASAGRSTQGGRLLAVAAAVAGVLAGVPAARAGADEGAAIADQWCARCHVVRPDQPVAVAGVPSFADIGVRLDDAAIRAALFSPHPPMPEFDLSSRRVDDVIDYIRSLPAPD